MSNPKPVVKPALYPRNSAKQPQHAGGGKKAQVGGAGNGHQPINGKKASYVNLSGVDKVNGLAKVLPTTHPADIPVVSASVNHQ